MKYCKLCKNLVKKIENITEPIYYFCPVCDFLFMDENYYLSPEKEKERYLMHDNSLENKGYVKMFENFIEKAVAPFIKKGQHVLDFGCGPSPVLKILLEREGFPTDIYDKYFFKEKVYLNKTYTLITATEVIEHLKNPLKAFHFFGKHLKKDGKLSLMTLFHPGIEQFSKWWYRQDPTHISFYSKKTFLWLHENTSFKILYLDDKNTVTLSYLPQ